MNAPNTIENYQVTDEAQAILDAIHDESDPRPIFVLGQAGTGKTALISHLTKVTKLQTAVLAYTGVAALNARGQTIHSFFRLPGGVLGMETEHLLPPDHPSHHLDVLVVDEMSMVRADLVDAIERQLRKNARTRAGVSEPWNTLFGGVKTVFVGDFAQLPPVVTDPDRESLDILYPKGTWPHQALSIRRRNFQQEKMARSFRLTRVWRQQEGAFLDLLNTLRHGWLEDNHYDLLDQRVVPGVSESDEVCMTLCPTNRRVKEINDMHLARLPGEVKVFRGVKTGRIPQNNGKDALPTDDSLELKIGAQVMFVANDPSGRWVNGTLGTLKAFTSVTAEKEKEDDADRVVDGVEVEVAGRVIPLRVAPHKFEFLEFETNRESRKVERKPVGTFTQLPLRLAWALTIHKAQGVTLDRVHIDLGGGAFAHGQVYVALSRCRTLEGLTLERGVWERDLIVDPAVQRYL